MTSDKHLNKFLKEMASEFKQNQKPLQEENLIEKLASNISGDKIDTSIPKTHSDLVNKSTEADRIPTAPKDIESQRWDDPLLPLDKKFVTHQDMNAHYSLFLKRIQQQLSTISGGGEVKFSRLDDVDASTIGPNRHLAYNPTTRKFFFEDVDIGDGVKTDGQTTQLNANNEVSVINVPNTLIGPVQSVLFDITHETESHSHDIGTLCWNTEDDTVNIFHSGGVVQQVGEELYLRVVNNTGNTIPNGTCVRFDGAESNGESFMEVAPFLGDGTFTSLYGVGIATQTILNGEKGRVAVWGKTRGIDTTGASVSEVWVVGDILYANPDISGMLTKNKPTAPENVFPVAAVLKVDVSDGEIFVRPTPTLKTSYGKFAKTTDATVTEINTPYAFTFDETINGNGVSLDVINSRLVVDQSGLYQIAINAQTDAPGGGFSGGTLFMWIRVNGVDVPLSTRRQGLVAGAPNTTFSYDLNVSLQANDYVEIMYAASSTSITLNASAATAFAPSTASLLVSIAQTQQ